MNVNLKPKTPTVNQWLREASDTLADKLIPSALLDAEIILAHSLRKNRAWLRAHDNDTVNSRQLEIADARLQLRIARVPIAYIIGHKEFYGRRFTVSPSVLIPRPESESIIELLKQNITDKYRRLIDVGTGSGCLGITAKLEFPTLDVTLSDISNHALQIARQNASNLHADVTTKKSDLLQGDLNKYDIIIANLPYVDKSWTRSPETNYEPATALFADNKGLGLIDKLIAQIPDALSVGGLIILEADPEQHTPITNLASKNRLQHIATDGYAVVFKFTS